MKDMEILNRASAFLVKARCPEFSKKFQYHVVTASHVVAPWKWPKYYPEEWLQFVNEKHTHYTVEMRQDNGIFMTQSELVPLSFHHPTRDLAALHLQDEEAVLKVFTSLGFCDLKVAGPGNLKFGEPLYFHGHDVRLNGFEDPRDDSDQRLPVPCVVKGLVGPQTGLQNFAKTQTVLTDGMCGGPVLAMVNGEEVVCGVTDGIIPATHEQERLRGLASFITSDELLKFLDSVEDGTCETKLVGGEAARHVGSDKDPEKMNLEAVIKKYSD